MKKYIFCLFLIVSLLLTSAANANTIVSVYVNGNILETDTPAIIVEGSTMLPFRAILNALGVTDSQIIWNEKSRSIEIKTDTNYIFLAIDNNAAIANDKLITLNAAPFIKDNRTMVPLRFISESLGAAVEWDSTKNAAFITK